MRVKKASRKLHDPPHPRHLRGRKVRPEEDLQPQRRTRVPQPAQAAERPLHVVLNREDGQAGDEPPQGPDLAQRRLARVDVARQRLGRHPVPLAAPGAAPRLVAHAPEHVLLGLLGQRQRHLRVPQLLPQHAQVLPDRVRRVLPEVQPPPEREGLLDHFLADFSQRGQLLQ
ncbi:hypothetical protein PG994_000501 [Apiospora phragmitis]|uniref:Uncharacterized protein n=1 Tax=Apiospora phragmitis TaxID=2905665 RepID=A0ABR1X6C5_9PEZI